MTDTLPFYRYRTPRERERPPTRVERAALQKLRNAVAWLQGQGAPASIEQEMTIAIETHAASLEARFNEGQPFPEVIPDLKPGRRRAHKRRAARRSAPASAD